MDSREDFQGCECFLSAMECNPPDTDAWADAVSRAWYGRRRAAPCGSDNLFCECNACAALPEKPEWMRSPQAVMTMAERVVAAAPLKGGNRVPYGSQKNNLAEAWEMHAGAHKDIDNFCTAAVSYMKAASRYDNRGDARMKTEMLERARDCRAKAEAIAKAAAEAEAARMAPIMAAREASADAAMQALLAEEKQENVEAASKPRKKKSKGRKK